MLRPFACLLITLVLSLGLLRSPTQAALFAKFGDLVGESITTGFEEWSLLLDFELTAGTLPTEGNRGGEKPQPLPVFDGAFVTEVGQEINGLLDFSFLSVRIPEIRIAYTTSSGGGGGDDSQQAYLEYEFEGAVLSPLTIDGGGTDGSVPLVSGRLLDPERLLVRYTSFGKDGKPNVSTETTYDYGRQTVSTVSTVTTLVGDYDQNGQVGLSDYEVWRELFGTTSSVADGNADGMVNAADYTVWRDAFDRLGSEPVIGATPEPATTGGVSLLLAATIAMRSRRLR